MKDMCFPRKPDIGQFFWTHVIENSYPHSPSAPRAILVNYPFP
jgi:hypothetical protein